MFTLMIDLGRNAERAIKAGITVYKNGHGSASVEEIQQVILQAMRAWQPKHMGKELLTPSLRIQFAKALGGLAYNIAAAEHRKAA